jgi:neutral amino acid transport system ATP-binding protein
VIDAYLGSHHDQDLDPETEERILAEAQAEIAEERGEEPAPAVTNGGTTGGEHRA